MRRSENDALGWAEGLRCSLLTTIGAITVGGEKPEGSVDVAYSSRREALGWAWPATAVPKARTTRGCSR